MADASCSGGTPFKRLMEHQSRDTSHHQDRFLNGNQTPTPFRNMPQNWQSDTQENFGAFLDSPNGLPGIYHDPADRLAAHADALQPADAASSFNQTVNPELIFQGQAKPDPKRNWTVDFSRFMARQPQHGQPQQRQGSMLAGAGAGAAAAAANPTQMGFQGVSGWKRPRLTPFFAPASAAYRPPEVAEGADFDQEMAKWKASHLASGNMEHVDAAMDEIARDLERHAAVLTAPQTEETAAESDTVAAAAETQQNRAHFSDLGLPELGNLSLETCEAAKTPEPLQAEEEEEEKKIMDSEMLVNETRNRNKSAVSEAAEQLLDKVQHESGEKWQNSMFLALMRDFRDGKMDIVGNEVQQTDGADKTSRTESG